MSPAGIEPAIVERIERLNKFSDIFSFFFIGKQDVLQFLTTAQYINVQSLHTVTEQQNEPLHSLCSPRGADGPTAEHKSPLGE